MQANGTTHAMKRVALEGHLKKCPQVVTLGVRPNFSDYSDSEKALIRKASKIYYPSSFYADLFDAMGKPTFPSYHTYTFAQDKIKQTAVFELLGIPHPRTRVYYGNRQKEMILSHFSFPFIAKVPRGSALGRGVFLIDSPEALQHYCQGHTVAYIQEYLPIERDMRIVVIGTKVVHAYWRTAPVGDFRSNVAVGGTIDLSAVPREAAQLALYTALACKWDDVGIDICQYRGDYYVLEGNMKYGRMGFRKAGIDYTFLMEQLIADGHI
jgi:ribosomal protein S6--L-glutamate ligase